MPPESTTVATSAPAALAGSIRRAMTPMPVAAIKAMVDTVQEVAQAVMKDGHHYGKIPGAGERKVLLKPGAQILMVTFQLRPQFVTEHRILLPDHVHFEVRCDLVSRTTDELVATGSGAASSLEVKHRYRKAQRECPDCGTAAIIKGKEQYGGGWLCWKKKDGCGAKFIAADGRITAQETGRVLNEDPHDLVNTLLKMANKRAMVDAVLNATAASDVFTQDLIEPEGRVSAQHEQTRQGSYGGNWDGEKPKRANDAQCGIIEDLRTQLEQAGHPAATFNEALEHYRAKSIRDLTTEQAEELITGMSGDLMRAKEMSDRIADAKAAEAPSLPEDSDLPF